MVFICRESQAAKTVFRYRDIAAFSLSKKVKKGFTENGLEISYDRNSFTPDEDTINAVLDGSMKAKKVIKNAIQELRNPSKAENPKDIIAATMVMNIITANSKRPNIVVFVLDDNPETPEEKAREKFLIKYVKAICEEFGVVPITKVDKKIKKLFKGKRKNIAKKLEKWLRSGKSGKYGPSRTTVRYCRKLITYFAVEMHQIGLSAKDPEDIGSKECRDLARTLANIFTNDNLKKICETSKKKEADKLCKKLAKKNKVAYETYEMTREVLDNISDGKYDLPEAEYGYPKKKKVKKQMKKLAKQLKKAKGKKAKKKLRKKIKKLAKTDFNKPLMNADKFVKKLAKGKMANILQLVYMNIAYVQLSGEKMGTPEWAKGIQKNITNGFGKEFATAFIDAAKKAAEAE